MKNELEKMQQQLIHNYKKALEDTIINNTDALINEDILSILKSPPLESMDNLKNKLYSLAKNENLVLEKEKVDEMFDDYYEHITISIKKLGIYRVNALKKVMINYKFKNEYDVVKFDSDVFNRINKNIKKNIKSEISKELKEILNEKRLVMVFKEKKESVNQKVIKKFQKNYDKYIKQIINNVEMKILIKDSILNNMIKDQGERYIFTKTNSRIYQ